MLVHKLDSGQNSIAVWFKNPGNHRPLLNLILMTYSLHYRRSHKLMKRTQLQGYRHSKLCREFLNLGRLTLSDYTLLVAAIMNIF